MLGVLPLVGAQSDCNGYSGGAVAGIAIGCCLAMLVILGIIAAIIYFKSKKKSGNVTVKKSANAGTVEQGYDNPTFAQNEEELKAQESKNKDKGFAGYVQCREYEASTRT